MTMGAMQKGYRCVTFLGNFVVDVDRAKRDCGGVHTRRRPQHATHNKSRESPCVFAVEDSVTERRQRQVAPASCRITTRKLPQVALRICVCGPFASWAWIPLEHGKEILVVHEFAKRIG